MADEQNNDGGAGGVQSPQPGTGAPDGAQGINTNEGQPQQNPTPTPPAPPEGEKMVQVPESLLKQVLANQEAQEKLNKEQATEIERLKYAADKGRLGIWDARNAAGEIIREANVGLWTIRDLEKGTSKDHYVLGTKMIQQDIAIEDNGGVRRLHEVQTLRVYLDNPDGEAPIELDMPYLRFYQEVKREKGTIIQTSKGENGTFLKLRMARDNRELEIDANFINY